MAPPQELTYSEPEPEPANEAWSHSKSPALSQLSLQPLQPIGIKNIRLKLSVPAESIDRVKSCIFVLCVSSSMSLHMVMARMHP